MESIEALEKRLKELDEAIAETERRLPAHSVKPPIMQELFALEDERADVKRRMTVLREMGSENK